MSKNFKNSLDDVYDIDSVHLEQTIQDIKVPDSVVFEELDRIAKTTETIPAPVTKAPLPEIVDYSMYLRYIRMQSGAGCWGHSMLAVWDIMNEIVCPFSPNLSINLWLMLHERRDLWEKQGGINSPDGRFHEFEKGPEYGFFQSFGNPTEGTQGLMRWWTLEGTNEADNYRLAAKLDPITVSSSDFRYWMCKGHPIRVRIPSQAHVVAIVGYDNSKKTFKYINSWGDRWGVNGFSTYTFDQIDKEGLVDLAEIIKIIPPKPVPAARIKVTTPENGGRRMNIKLWLSVEGSPLPKREIWPVWEWADNSRNLHYTVRLPSEFIWPPSKNNRLVLDLYDSGAFSDTGGTVEEFTAAFGGHIVKCSELSRGPVSFKAYEHKCFCIP